MTGITEWPLKVYVNWFQTWRTQHASIKDATTILHLTLRRQHVSNQRLGSNPWSWCSWRPQEGFRLPGTGVTDGCESPCWWPPQWRWLCKLQRLAKGRCSISSRSRWWTEDPGENPVHSVLRYRSLAVWVLGSSEGTLGTRRKGSWNLPPFAVAYPLCSGVLVSTERAPLVFGTLQQADALGQRGRECILLAHSWRLLSWVYCMEWRNWEKAERKFSRQERRSGGNM